MAAVTDVQAVVAMTTHCLAHDCKHWPSWRLYTFFS